MKTTKLISATLVSLLVVTDAAFAHPGHGTSGIAAGLAHPMAGLDHLLAMVAVGVWAAMQPAARAWQAPVAFMTMLAAGAGLGLAGVQLPMVEPGIVASVILFGAMILAGRTLPASAGLVMVGAFALLHGHAHGTEAAGAIGPYMAGFLVASAALHAFGYVAGRSVATLRYGLPVTGVALMAAGALLVGA